MRRRRLLIIVAVIAIVVYLALTLKVFPDPYYHTERVSFVEWLKREIIELLTGER